MKDIRRRDLESLKKDEIEGMVDFANAMGALTTSKIGAIPAIPDMEDIIGCIKNMPEPVR